MSKTLDFVVSKHAMFPYVSVSMAQLLEIQTEVKLDDSERQSQIRGLEMALCAYADERDALASRNVELNAEIARYRHLGTKYLGWLDVVNPGEAIELDIANPEMFEGTDIAPRSALKE